MSVKKTSGSALIVALACVAILSGLVLATYSGSIGTLRRSDRAAHFVATEATANAVVELIHGQFGRWIDRHGGLTPSVAEIESEGITSIKALASAGRLSGYEVAALLVPVMPNDEEGSIVFPDSTTYFTDNSAYRDAVRRFFTYSPSLNDNSFDAEVLTYKAEVTVRPMNQGSQSGREVTIERFFQISKVDPFRFSRFNNGTLRDGSSNRIYHGPLHGVSLVMSGSGMVFHGALTYVNSFKGASNHQYLDGAPQQTTHIELVGDIKNALAKNEDGTRTADLEDGPASANSFSTRELIEPPVPGVEEPAAFRTKRAYHQADIKIMAEGHSVRILDNADQDITNTELGRAILPAVSMKDADSPVPFYDRGRSTTEPIKTTDINVGALKTVIEANPTEFPSRLVYVSDATATVKTGVRLYNGGRLPGPSGSLPGGLTVVSNNAVYIKGDYNTGTTLSGDVTVDTADEAIKQQPASNSLPKNVASIPDQRRTGDYTVQPAGVFGDTLTELSQRFTDAYSNDTNRPAAISTTINAVEGLGTSKPNELRPDDTFVDASKVSIRWLENWANKRRTTCGAELQLYHSKETPAFAGGGWWADTSFDPVINKVGWDLSTRLITKGRYYRK